MDKLEKDVLSLITEDSRLPAKKIASMLGCDENVVSQKIS